MGIRILMSSLIDCPLCTILSVLEKIFDGIFEIRNCFVSVPRGRRLAVRHARLQRVHVREGLRGRQGRRAAGMD